MTDKNLTKINLKKYNMQKLKAMLPLLTELSSFHIIRKADLKDNILVNLSMTKLQKFSLSSVQILSKVLNNEILSIKNLTIFGCHSSGLMG